MAETGGVGAPVRIEVFMDYHCPYSHRVVCWLDDLTPGLAEIRHRFFALEQVNRDPEAAQWRIWEQPLDYEHHLGRQDRRVLAAFLATAAVEAAGTGGEIVRRFRRAIYAARFEDRLDIADPNVLDAAGVRAGLPAGWVRAALLDEASSAAAREVIGRDWAAARSPWLVFGVPTLVIDEEAPFYLRLAEAVPPAKGVAFLAALRAFRAAAPGVLELKQPERTSAD